MSKPKGNIDITPGSFIVLHAKSLRRRKAPVSSISAAVTHWSEFRDTFHLGSSDMMQHCGKIYNAEGAEIGHISYNGRAWGLDGNPVDGMTGDEWVASASI